METVKALRSSAKAAIAAINAEWCSLGEKLVKDIATARSNTAAVAAAIALAAEGKATLRRALEERRPSAILERIAGACLTQDNDGNPFFMFGHLHSLQQPEDARGAFVDLLLAVGGDRLEKTLGEIMEKKPGLRISRSEHKAKLAAAEQAELSARVDLARLLTEATDAGVELHFYGHVTPEAFKIANGPENWIGAGILLAKRTRLIHAGIVALGRRQRNAVDLRNGLRARVAALRPYREPDRVLLPPTGTVMPPHWFPAGSFEEEIGEKAAKATAAAARDREPEVPPALAAELVAAEATVKEITEEGETEKARWEDRNRLVKALVEYAKGAEGWERLRDTDTSASGDEPMQRGDIIKTQPDPDVRAASHAAIAAGRLGDANSGYQVLGPRFRR